jgi:hypothetical protein
LKTTSTKNTSHGIIFYSRMIKPIRGFALKKNVSQGFFLPAGLLKMDRIIMALTPTKKWFIFCWTSFVAYIPFELVPMICLKKK